MLARNCHLWAQVLLLLVPEHTLHPACQFSASQLPLEPIDTTQRQLLGTQLAVTSESPLIPREERVFAQAPNYFYRTQVFMELLIHMAAEENFQMQAASNSVALHFLTLMQATKASAATQIFLPAG